MDETFIYRVRQSRDHPVRRVRHAWYGRTWQAEWTGTLWCPRAWTRRGVERKAARWRRRGWPTWGMVNRRRWLRIQVARYAPFPVRNGER